MTAAPSGVEASLPKDPSTALVEPSASSPLAQCLCGPPPQQPPPLAQGAVGFPQGGISQAPPLLPLTDEANTDSFFESF